MNLTDLFLHVQLDKLINNLTSIKQIINQDNVKIMAVVKSNAYGHGAITIAKTLESYVDFLGVGKIEEALELRDSDIKAPILIMGPSFDYDKIVDNNLTTTTISLEHYKELLNYAKQNNKQLAFHLKVDTGMHRFGIRLDQINEFLTLYDPEFTILEGVYSHFATTFKNNKKMVIKQNYIFEKFVETFKEQGFSDILYHIANSENAIDYKMARYNMVRIGNALYGPCNSLSNVKLEKIAQLKAKVICIQHIKKGERIGYGLSYKAKKDTKVAVLSIGFYEGYEWMKKPVGVGICKLGKVLLKEVYRYIRKRYNNIYCNNVAVKIVGIPNMQFTMIDITNIKNIETGDYVTIKITPLMLKESIYKVYDDGGNKHEICNKH